MTDTDRFPAGRLLCLTAAVYLAVVAPCRALDYYVAVDGANTNAGRPETDAWRTIAHAAANVASGDVINVATGNYAEWVIITNPVTITGADVYHPSYPVFSRHESRTVIRPYDTDNRESALFTVLTNNVTLQNLTIIGDGDTNGIADIKCGMYCTNGRPFTVSNCAIYTVGGYGICHVVDGSIPSPSDADDVRSYFGYNTITNITHTNAVQATGIFLEHVPSTVENNAIGNITGASANAGLYVHSCYYTAGMARPFVIDYNHFEDCVTAVWANSFGTDDEPIYIRNNTVTNSVRGIRISEAKGAAYVGTNNIAVSGVSPGGTPARGLWIEADYDPWNPLRDTDHQLTHNRISGSAANADGSMGMVFRYDSALPDVDNNGVRAAVLDNDITGFDWGVYVLSGSNGVTRPHDHPLTEVILHRNNMESNITWCLAAQGNTNPVNAVSNWWGRYDNPACVVSGNVTYTPYTMGGYRRDTDGDGVDDNIDDDDDSDSLTDAEEVIAGTDPSDAYSVFQLAGVSREGTNGIKLSWAAASNRIYSIYRSTNILDGFGAAFTSVPAVYPTNTYTDYEAGDFSPLFYRISVTNAP
ncbi:MAG: hypothetical protein R6V03_08755 [Kiritimatiellia bacterium]